MAAEDGVYPARWENQGDFKGMGLKNQTLAFTLHSSPLLNYTVDHCLGIDVVCVYEILIVTFSIPFLWLSGCVFTWI